MTLQTTWPNLAGTNALNTAQNVRPLPGRHDESWRHFPLRQLKSTFEVAECPPEVTVLSGNPQIGKGETKSAPDFKSMSDWVTDLAIAYADPKSIELADGDSVALIFKEPAKPGSFAPSRFQVRVTAGSVVDLKLEFHSSASKKAFWRHTSVELLLERDSRCRMVYTQVEPESALHITQVSALQEDRSVLEAFCGDLGSKSARAGFAIQTGSDCHTDIRSILIGKGASHHSFTSVIKHQGTGSKSRQLVKNILRDSSNGSFHGVITIPETGQKTDAQQLGRALLLGETAQMASQPQLEIEADDVKCQHGAAISRPTPEELFYFLARGIDEQTATGMLAQAFASETLIGLPEDDQLTFFQTAMNETLGVQ